MVGNFKKRRQKFRDRFHLTHDVLRHTFISMFVAKFRSIGEAAIQAGNSESIIRRHYLDLKTTAEADEFFSICRDTQTPFFVGSQIGPVDTSQGALWRIKIIALWKALAGSFTKTAVDVGRANAPELADGNNSALAKS